MPAATPSLRAQAEAIWKIARPEVVKALKPKPRDSELDLLVEALIAAAKTLDRLAEGRTT